MTNSLIPGQGWTTDLMQTPGGFVAVHETARTVELLSEPQPPPAPVEPPADDEVGDEPDIEEGA